VPTLDYVAVGRGHPDGVAFWTRFVSALHAAGYEGPLSIENEDYTVGQRESVALAVATLRDALAGPGTDIFPHSLARDVTQGDRRTYGGGAGR